MSAFTFLIDYLLESVVLIMESFLPISVFLRINDEIMTNFMNEICFVYFDANNRLIDIIK